ncbi:MULTISPECIES: hypothetical protein [Pseudomonas]|uniref:Uncharacterized protein n=1 Tax=Pseudomonas putida TaxID=303 RepID=A0A2S3WQF9_PSEPU|nr:MULTISPECIES: hypothetical protein [Pseudomonas]MBI6918125.1 hypothetical protein [Pseudomonas monteilii]MCE0938080.1 hypothetical protein [Pseudomonas kurunegalensis]MDD2015307.1 hypothetical protein [Pseudomonas putida]POG03555.1 hypothetical protein BGP82_20010 [Pseudomonas putida]HDS1770248.1 hypothetical protein [Pseudomonas putida]
MSQATQVFNGVMFITNPFEKRVAGAFIRVDVLERRFAESIKASSDFALERFGQLHLLYEMSLLSTLRNACAALAFPHNKLFEREAEQQDFQLDMENYLAAQKAAAVLRKEIDEGLF